MKCTNCNQLLLKADYVKGEIKCPRCKKINKLEFKPKDRA
ncbi:Com family DNA-binding transcriptional regulator [Terrisporobacter mayombei]|nr:Com family DNA-binding transcriptional regulator [Terrisporobacter mayombei]MCC3870290.1 Com family DNA-binding transcriptional regulator [Terrisporobacter mayombei]